MSFLTPDHLPWDALARYFAGEMEGPEAEALGRWIDEDPERRELVKRLREIWVEAATLRQSWDAEAALRRIKQAPRKRARHSRPAARGGAETPPVPRRVFAAAFAIAATLAIVVGGLAVWQAGLFSRGEKEPQTEVATRRGQRVTVRFPDGTAVLLGPVSRLRYAVGFRGRPRKVDLGGQVSLTVITVDRHPYDVRTANAVVRDRVSAT